MPKVWLDSDSCRETRLEYLDGNDWKWQDRPNVVEVRSRMQAWRGMILRVRNVAWALLAGACLVTEGRAQQNVQGVVLGVTSMSTIISARGAPSDSGKSNDGWLYVAFGADLPRYFYYFSPDDSIVEWARVFVIDGYTASRVHEAFGRPDTVEYGEDLSKKEEFSRRNVVVEYRANGDVSYIEYHTDFGHSIGSRRASRAYATIDTLMSQSLRLDNPALNTGVAMDSVRIFRKAFELRIFHPYSGSKTPLSRLTLIRAARYDSLCVVVTCDLVARNMRAGDHKP